MKIKRLDIEKQVKKTLNAEIKAVSSIKNIKSSKFKKVASIISEVNENNGKIITTGVGKSGFIAMKLSATLSSLGVSSHFLNPLDALHGDIGFINNGDVLIALSHSGNSIEIIKLLKYLKKNFDIEIIGITGSKKGELVKELSDESLIYDLDNEGCAIGYAPMASTTASLVICDILSSLISVIKGTTFNDFAKNHPAGSLGLQTKHVCEYMKKGKNVPVVYLEDEFNKVIKSINSKKLGLTVVCDRNNLPKGIITDGDIRRSLEDTDGSILNNKAKDLMSKNPKRIKSDDTLHTAFNIIEKNKITSLIVINKKGELDGIVHIHDILSI